MINFALAITAMFTNFVVQTWFWFFVYPDMVK